MNNRPHGFSLVETILAIGATAGGLVSLLGLLSAVARQAAETQDGVAVARVFAELDAAVSRLPSAELFDTVGEGPLTFFAARDAKPWGTSSEIAPDERFFFVRMEADPDLMDLGDGGIGYIALQITIEWPYHTPDGSITAPEQRNRRGFSIARAR